MSKRTEDDMKAELISHDMITLEELAKIKDPTFKTKIHSLLSSKYNKMIDTDPNDLENTYAKMVGEGDYQCGSCEQFFDHTDDAGDCPHCSSGNIVEGSIDDPVQNAKENFVNGLSTMETIQKLNNDWAKTVKIGNDPYFGAEMRSHAVSLVKTYKKIFKLLDNVSEIEEKLLDKENNDD